MNENEMRPSLLFSLAGLGVSQVLPGVLAAEARAHEGYILGAHQGEQLVHFRDQGNIFIKIGPATGSEHLAVGTQQVMAGSGIPVHRHLEMDEAFYVLEGSGTLTLNDVPHTFEKGATIYIPRMTWHGFANPDHEVLMLWIVSPAGLDGFFGETCSPPGGPPKKFTREQVKEIALKYQTEFR